MTSARPESDGLKIKIGKWFEASATGRFGMALVAAVWISLLIAKVLGWL